MKNNQLKVDGRKNYVISIYAGRVSGIATRAKIELCGKASIYWFIRIAELDVNHLANLINAFKEETSLYITPDGIEVMAWYLDEEKSGKCIASSYRNCQKDRGI